jgi:alkanesulfonate monooxygenase SsuD/methylene tetrahydromethanopterin reductase-like flavin-dependent oxidoreductase (luciferase family)
VAFSSPAEVGECYSWVREACERAGRDPSELRYSAAVVVCVGVDDAEIAKRAAAIGREVEELRANGVLGTPAQAAERIGDWVDVGAECVYLQILDLADVDHLRLIGREVAPKLA